MAAAPRNVGQRFWTIARSHLCDELAHGEFSNCGSIAFGKITRLAGGREIPRVVAGT